MGPTSSMPDMNFTPVPSILTTVISLFRRRTPQPKFTPAVPLLPTQVFITRDTITHIDPPVHVINITGSFSNKHSESFNEKHQDLPVSLHSVSAPDHKQSLLVYPETPRAPHPHRTSFILEDWESTGFAVGKRYYDNDDELRGRSDTLFGNLDLDIPPGRTIVCHPTEPGVYTVAEPRTLAQSLFIFGFVFPPFWIAGMAILLLPLQTTRDWELGKTNMEIEWACKVIRQTELKWAKRCLVALLSEISFILATLIIVKWGIANSV